MHKGSSPPQDTHANQSVHRFVVLEHSFGVFQLLWCPRSATMLYPSRMFSGEGFGVSCTTCAMQQLHLEKCICSKFKLVPNVSVACCVSLSIGLAVCIVCMPYLCMYGS